MSSDKRTKSFSLKNDNADKIEAIAYEEKVRESSIVDKLIEEME